MAKPGLDWSHILHISKSQLATYLQCPRRFYFQYVLSQPWEFVPASLAFGKAVHAAVAWFYQVIAQRQEKPAPVSLLDQFRHTWQQAANQALRFPGGQTTASLADLGEHLMAVFHAEIQPRRIRAVEAPFQVDLPDGDGGSLDVKLVGMIDVIEEDDEGHVIVSELKTSGKRYTEIQAEHQLDGLIYGYAADQLGLTSDGERSVLVRYDILVKTKQPAFQQLFFPRGPDDHRRFLRWTRALLDGIEAQTFYPNYGWPCQQCPFQKACWDSHRQAGGEA